MRCFVVPDGAPAATQNSYARILAIHAALLPNGKIVYFSGDQHDPGQFAHGLFDHARLFDCTSFAVSPCTPAPGISDLFCCGHALLQGGNILIAGGTLRFDGFEGAPDAWLFDPPTSTFTRVASMTDGRWYPTLLTLGDGSVLAVSGLNAAGDDDNRNLEVFNPGGSHWTVEGVLPHATDTLYPRLHLLPDRRVFFVSPMNGQCATWRPGDAAPTNVCPSPFVHMGFSSYSSALLPLLPEEAYAPRVLVANIAQPQVINLAVAAPSWTNTGMRNVPVLAPITNATPLRLNGTLTMLPTGEVLSSGGEEAYGDESHPVHPLEIYRPSTNSWVTMPVQTSVTRAYHSTALLMPDGRVWFAGSNKRCDWSLHNSADYAGGPEPTTPQEPGVDNRELRIEIFEPWYFSRPDRPTISLGGGTVGVGHTFTLTSPQAAAISRVALLRAGSSTHAFNTDQRYVGLTFTRAANTLTVAVPDNDNLVPPGPYLVFALAQVVDAGTGATLDVPSMGHFIDVVNSKLFKELKPEIDIILIKEEFEIIKETDVIDPGTIDRGDPAWLLQRLAIAVDNLARGGEGMRTFIKPNERPQLPQVSARRLASVPIYAIDPQVLQSQVTMEGMPAKMISGAAAEASMPMGNKARKAPKKPRRPRGGGNAG